MSGPAGWTETGKIIFGPFEFDREARILSRNGIPIKLRTSELDLLTVLMDNAGRHMSNDDLLKAAFRSKVPTNLNLIVQMAGLQRVLNGPGVNTGPAGLAQSPLLEFKKDKGYRFNLPGAAEHEASEIAWTEKKHNLPPQPKRLLGREATLDQLLSALRPHCLVSVLGDGGIGKTTVALAAAYRALEGFRHGAWFVDLTGVEDRDVVADKIASTLNIPTIAASRRTELIRWLADKELLLLLDNIDHPNVGIAALLSQILEGGPMVAILATSRLPMAVEWEKRICITSLAHPPVAPMTAGIALTFPAFAFFVDCLRENGGSFDLTSEGVQLLIRLCVSLRGNPLAIELVAAQIREPYRDTRPIEAPTLSAIALAIASSCEQQDTVQAILEWSYENLSDKARWVLQGLSVCRREFTAATAVDISADNRVSTQEVLVCLDELSRNSLLIRDEASGSDIYHMLSIVRDFAASKVEKADGHKDFLRRHALNCVDQIRKSGVDRPDTPGAVSPEDIRAAVDWCFSNQGDALTGMRLISLTVGNRRTLYGIQDYARLLDKALARYAELQVSEPALELRLIVERMCINQHAENDETLMARLNHRAFELANSNYDSSGDPADLLAIHQNEFGLRFAEGNGPANLRTAQDMEALAARTGRQTEIELLSLRMNAQACHLMGYHHKAIPLMRRARAMSDEQVRRQVSLAGERVDPRIILGIFDSRTSWLLGYPEKACADAANLVETVRSNWDYMLCYVIAFAAFPIAIWRGDTPKARGYLQDLRIRASDFKLDYWTTWSDCYACTLALLDNGSGPANSPAPTLFTNNLQADMLATFNEGLLTKTAIDRVKNGLVGWCAPDILRSDADCGMRNGVCTAGEGQTRLLEALDLAKTQNALAWQLRIATSLGRLWRYQGKASQAKELLAATLGQFTEGFNDSDLVSAAALLQDI